MDAINPDQIERPHAMPNRTGEMTMLAKIVAKIGPTTKNDDLQTSPNLTSTKHPQSWAKEAEAVDQKLEGLNYTRLIRRNPPQIEKWGCLEIRSKRTQHSEVMPDGDRKHNMTRPRRAGEMNSHLDGDVTVNISGAKSSKPRDPTATKSKNFCIW